MVFKVVTKALILDGNKILIVKRSNNDNFTSGEETFPGGFVKEGEKLTESVKREVKEETNLEVDVIKTNTAWTVKGKENNMYIVGVTFLCKPKTKKIKLNKELESYRWASIKNYKKEELPEWMVKEIKALKAN